MAVTVIESPQQYTPSDNPVTWVFSSDQTAQPNFHFLIEVYINTGGLSFDLVSRHKVYPESGSSAHFNAKSITERYANIHDINRVLFKDNTDNYNSIRLTVTEYYGTTPTAQASATTGDVIFFKSRQRKREFINFVFSDYRLTNATSGKLFLTDRPRNTSVKVATDESIFLSIINDFNSFGYEITSYDIDGNTTIYSQSASSADMTNNIITYDLSPSRLVSDFFWDFTNIAYYDFQAKANLGGFSESFRIYIDNDCTYSQKKRLHFLNSYGVYDSFTFGLFSRESHEVESFGYEKQFGSFDGSGNYSYSLQGGSNVDYLKQFNRSLEVTSDWLGQDVQNWLSKELYTSPCVYIEEEGKFYRVKVTNKGFNKKIQENDMLFQEVVTIELEKDSSVNL